MKYLVIGVLYSVIFLMLGACEKEGKIVSPSVITLAYVNESTKSIFIEAIIDDSESKTVMIEPGDTYEESRHIINSPSGLVETATRLTVRFGSSVVSCNDAPSGGFFRPCLLNLGNYETMYTEDEDRVILTFTDMTLGD